MSVFSATAEISQRLSDVMVLCGLRVALSSVFVLVLHSAGSHIFFRRALTGLQCVNACVEFCHKYTLVAEYIVTLFFFNCIMLLIVCHTS